MLAALAVFEIAVAGSVTGMVAMVTLQASIWQVAHLAFLPIFSVMAGALILVVCRPGDKEDEPADAASGGEPQS